MSIGGGLSARVTQLAVGRHLPRRTVRVRLTLLYGGLFLLSGAALMAIAYALLVNAGFVFSLQNPTSTGPVIRPLTFTTPGRPHGLPGPGATTRPSAQTMAHWRDVAQCIRRHGVTGFPDPTSSVPTMGRPYFELSDHDGAIFVIPSAIDMQSATFTQTAIECGFMDAYQRELIVGDNRRRSQVRQELLIQSAIALAGMSLLSLGLGWLVAGRVLAPLEDSYRAQRQFVANASHELRTPLARQRALIQVALADPQASFASLRAAHERVLASEQHLEQMIEGLLTLTRGQAGIDRREHVDLADVASQVMFARQPQGADPDLDVRTALATATTTGDPRLIEGLIANLIDNAIRHNTPGGHVEISTGTRDRHAFVSVANTGPPVPSEQIGRLFQPFQRLGDARTRHDRGHGLGLSIVQAIADAHRAQLSVRPQPEGGLAIDVVFPPAPSSDSKAALDSAWTKRGGLRAGLRD